MFKIKIFTLIYIIINIYNIFLYLMLYLGKRANIDYLRENIRNKFLQAFRKFLYTIFKIDN